LGKGRCEKSGIKRAEKEGRWLELPALCISPWQFLLDSRYAEGYKSLIF